MVNVAGGGGGRSRPTRQAMEDLLFRDPALQIGPKVGRAFDEGTQGLVPDAPSVDRPSVGPEGMESLLQAKKKRRSKGGPPPGLEEIMANLASSALPEELPRAQTGLPTLEELMSLIGR